jgi:hydroxymethylpyrimidine pyrophosphatase-like HAD family hydrolase
MKYKLLALDIDGTLESDKIPLNPQLKSLIKQFENLGGITTLISGRLPGGMVECAEKLDLPQGRIISGADGAVTVSLKANLEYNVVNPLEINYSKIAPVLAPYAGLLLTPHKVIEVGPVNKIMHYLAQITAPNLSKVNSWENAKEFVGNEPIIGLRFLLEREYGNRLVQLLQNSHSNRFEIFDNKEFSNDYIGIAVRPQHGDKGEILQTLASHYKTTIESTIALGDWVTDIPMLLKAGYSIAPSDSLNHVKNSAKHISQWNMEENWAMKELENLLFTE